MASGMLLRSPTRMEGSSEGLVLMPDTRGFWGCGTWAFGPSLDASLRGTVAAHRQQQLPWQASSFPNTARSMQYGHTGTHPKTEVRGAAPERQCKENISTADSTSMLILASLVNQKLPLHKPSILYQQRPSHLICHFKTGLTNSLGLANICDSLRRQDSWVRLHVNEQKYLTV